MAITNINGIPLNWDEETDKNLIGSLFPDGILPLSFSNSLPSYNNSKIDFKSISRNTWSAMRHGTSYQQRDIDTGPYTVNFYGLKEDEGIDLPDIISFIKKSISDCTIPFYWKDFEKPANYRTYRQKDTEGGFIDKM